MRRLHWVAHEDGRIEFSCDEEGRALPVWAWGESSVKTAAGSRARPGLLVAIIDTPGVARRGDTGVVLDPERIALLPSWQLHALGLPPPSSAESDS